MRVFQTGRYAWELALSIAAARRIKAHLSIDLLKADQPDADQQIPVLLLSTDPELLIRTVAVLCHDQLQERFGPAIDAGQVDEISGEPMTLLDLFALELGDGAYEKMRQAFLEELRDFFRRLGLEPRAALLAKQIEAIQQSYKESAKQIAALNLAGRMPEVDLGRILDESLTRGSSSKSSPPSVGSTTPAG